MASEARVSQKGATRKVDLVGPALVGTNTFKVAHRNVLKRPAVSQDAATESISID